MNKIISKISKFWSIFLFLFTFVYFSCGNNENNEAELIKKIGDLEKSIGDLEKSNNNLTMIIFALIIGLIIIFLIGIGIGSHVKRKHKQQK